MKIIDRVTVTGADDSTNINDLIRLSKKYPWVEWGILLSKSNIGGPRFPSKSWLKELGKVNEKHPMNISIHLCGLWLRDLCSEGNIDFIDNFLFFRPKRMQLNFHGITHKVDQDKIVTALKKLHGYMIPGVQFIFQFDDINNDLLDIVVAQGIDAVPLFDTSGGAGILPKQWPIAKGYCGYAGGLSPGNIHEQMKKIIKVAGSGPIWIDAETHLRTSDNRALEVYKVELFLAAAANYIQD